MTTQLLIDDLARDALVGILIGHFKKSECPTRKLLGKELIKACSWVENPKLDLALSQILNSLVDQKILCRQKAKFYAPGPRYYAEVPE